MFVLKSVYVSKEGMVKTIALIKMRKLSHALELRTLYKTIVAVISQDNEAIHLVKCYWHKCSGFGYFKKRHRAERYIMIENMVRRLHEHVKSHLLDAVNFRNIFQFELFKIIYETSDKEVVMKAIINEQKKCNVSGEEATFLTEEQLHILPLTIVKPIGTRTDGKFRTMEPEKLSG